MDGLIAYALAKKYTDKVGQDIISAGFKVQVEEDRSILNRQGEEKVLYLLPKEYGSSQDGYDEFVYANNTWEWVGKTDVSLDYADLSNQPTINGKTLRPAPLDNSLGYLDLQRSMIGSINESKIDQAMDIQTSDGKDSGFFALLGDNSVFNGSVVFQYRHRGYYPLNGNRYGQYGYGYYQFKFPRINSDGETIEPLLFRTSIPKKDGSLERVISDWQEIGGGAQIVSGVVNANGTITFTDSEGNSFTTSGESVIGPQGAPGQDYVLTAQDKTDIADIVLGELPTTEGVLYGNQSN